MKQAADSVLQETVRQVDAAGVVAIAVADSGVVYHGAAGHQNHEDGVEMAEDTVFYIASMTKAVTSVAAMQCVERGSLTLDDPIDSVLPALSNPPVLTGYEANGDAILRPAERPITLRHLLTHTSGLAYTTWNEKLFEYRQRHPDATPVAGPDIRRSAPLVNDPGETWEYSTSTDFVGLAVEAVSGKSLAEYFEEHIFAPLGMGDSGFVVTAPSRDRVASLYHRKQDGSLEREAKPDPAQRGLMPAFCSGGGGLYSTAMDYARFMSALLRLDTFTKDQEPLVSAKTMKEMASNQIGELTAGRMPSCEPWRSYAVELFAGTRPDWGLGFLINPQAVAGGRAKGSLAWAGLYNTYYWLDPQSRVAGAMFTQVLPFADPRILARFEAFERAVYG